MPMLVTSNVPDEGVSRRSFLRCAAATGLVSAASLGFLTKAKQATAEELKTFRCYGIPTIAPPDWSTFKAETGMDMQWLDIGPGYMGGFIQEVEVNKRGDFTDGLLFEGGIQMKLGPDGYFMPLDPAKMPLWDRTPDKFKKGPLYQGKDGTLYGVPTIMNADSFGYWPEELGATPGGSEELSWALLYESDKTKGRSSVNDQWVLTMPTAANYLKVAKGAKINDPANLTPEEAKTVADFLIDRKRAGQFRVLWSSFEESIDLLGNKEAVIINCWKPAVEELKRRKLPVQWAYAKEGYYKWGNGAYVASQVAKRGTTDAAYKAMNYFLGGAYGAVIADYRGHGTANMDLSIQYAKEHNWPEEKIQKIKNIQAEVTRKYEKPFWNNLAPDHATEIETEFERFKNA